MFGHGTSFAGQTTSFTGVNADSSASLSDDPGRYAWGVVAPATNPDTSAMVAMAVMFTPCIPGSIALSMPQSLNVIARHEFLDP